MDETEIKGIVTKRRQELDRYKSEFMSNQKRIRPSRDFPSTYETCKRELSENPWNLSAIRSLAQTSYNSGEYILAIYLLDDLARNPEQPDPEQEIKVNLGFAHYKQGVRLLAQEQWKASEESLIRAKEILGTYTGNNKEQKDRVDKAIVDIDIKIPTAQYSSGKNIEELEKIKGQSRKLDKQDWEGKRDFSELEEKLNDKNESPAKRAKAAQEIADNLLRRGEYDEALKYLRMAEPIDTSSDTTKEILGIRYKMLDSKDQNTEDLEVLAEDYKSLSEKRPNDPEVNMTLGKINFTLKRWLDAIKVTQKNMPVAENQRIEAELLIADSLLKMGASQAAELQFERTSQKTKEKEGEDYIHAMYGLGVSQEQQGKKDDAKKSFSEVIRLSIDHKDALERLKGLQQTQDCQT